MEITITEFAKARNVDRGTVNAFIRRYPEIAEQCRMDHKDRIIDTESAAFALLDKQYPLPQMVQVVDDPETREELMRAQKQIISLQEQLRQLTEQLGAANTQIAQHQSVQLLLDEKEEKISSQEQKIQTLTAESNERAIAQARAEQDKEAAEKAQQTAQEAIKAGLEREKALQAKIDRLNSRTLFERIFNKQ